MEFDCKKYYSEYYNADIYGNFEGEDDGFYEVHHIDFNERNNRMENLILLPESLHKKVHSVTKTVRRDLDIRMIPFFNEPLVNRIEQIIKFREETLKWYYLKRYMGSHKSEEIKNISEIIKEYNIMCIVFYKPELRIFENDY